MAWPRAAHAQRPAMPAIGYLQSASPSYYAQFIGAVSQGLKEAGYIEDQNVVIERRSAEGHYDRLAALAADLVGRQVAVILAAGGSDPAKEAKAATSDIPIVFVSAADPVRTDYPSANSQREEAQQAAARLGLRPVMLSAHADGEIDLAFASAAKQGADALLVATDPFLLSRRERLVALAARYAVPAIYAQREVVTAGGLISYGPRFWDGYRQAGAYVGRVLKGEKPADLPVLQPTKFELVINLKTAKALGLEVPDRLLALADEVIE
ncbi:MAG: hypothetical protein AUI16_18655 [Alphaproteobacteria bacterium 13_2_20CM_2_64_7]|nr:MAG: hypothetical protein AUI16_18655 [Alphaproteobacteria bacterium 13_2_20CM_2_64_7]